MRYCGERQNKEEGVAECLHSCKDKSRVGVGPDRAEVPAENALKTLHSWLLDNSPTFC